MIRFENISKGYMIRGRWHQVIDRLDLELPGGQSLALLGRNGAGKSTLLQMIAGNVRPSTGRIISDGTISFPVGYAGSFHQDLTGAQNTRFIARVYGVDSDELAAFTEDFAGLGKYFHMPVRYYSSGMVARLNFGVSMGIRFDTYLVDEVTSVGDAAFRARSQALFQDRMAQSGAILVSQNFSDIWRFCSAGVVLDQGRLTLYHNLAEAIAHHKEIMARPPAPVDERSGA